MALVANSIPLRLQQLQIGLFWVVSVFALIEVGDVLVEDNVWPISCHRIRQCKKHLRLVNVRLAQVLAGR